MGVTKTVAEVENIDYISMAESLDIGTVINKKMIAASHIYQMMLDADVSNVKCLTFANADVAEFTVKNGSRITKCAVKDAGLPKGATIGGLIRNGEGILVTGNTVIQPNDHVVVFCLGMMIKKIENSSIDDKCKMIARIMGALFFIEAGFLILCSFLAVYYNESDISAFLYSAAITAGAGSIAALAGKNAEKRISRRDGYVIVTLAWVFFLYSVCFHSI